MSITDEEKRLLGYKTQAAERRLHAEDHITPTYAEDVVLDWPELLAKLLGSSEVANNRFP